MQGLAGLVLALWGLVVVAICAAVIFGLHFWEAPQNPFFNPPTMRALIGIVAATSYSLIGARYVTRRVGADRWLRLWLPPTIVATAASAVLVFGPAWGGELVLLLPGGSAILTIQYGAAEFFGIGANLPIVLVAISSFVVLGAIYAMVRTRAVRKVRGRSTPARSTARASLNPRLASSAGIFVGLTWVAQICDFLTRSLTSGRDGATLYWDVLVVCGLLGVTILGVLANSVARALVRSHVRLIPPRAALYAVVLGVIVAGALFGVSVRDSHSPVVNDAASDDLGHRLMLLGGIAAALLLLIGHALVVKREESRAAGVALAIVSIASLIVVLCLLLAVTGDALKASAEHRTHIEAILGLW